MLNWLYLNKSQFMKRCILLMAIFAICMTVNAKDDFCDILRSRIYMHLCQLNDYLAFISDKSNDLETRQFYKKQALNMFMGRGYDYEENGIHKDGVKIIISSINNANGHTHTKLVRQYLNGLVNLTYQKVLIEVLQSSDFKVSDIQMIDDDHFTFFINYSQAFIGKSDDVSIYKDVTQKRIKCYGERIECEDGFEYSVLLGDIYAIDTKLLK